MHYLDQNPFALDLTVTLPAVMVILAALSYVKITELSQYVLNYLQA